MYADKKTTESLNKKLILGIILNIAFTIFEFIIGIFSGSLVLISDASHNLTDVTSLIISFFAHKIAQKKPDIQKTYGYGRVTILAALVNVIILIVLAIYIFVEAYHRFYEPAEIEGGLVSLVGLGGIIVNGGVALLFLKYKDDLNVQSALINMIFDAIASAGALIAGLIIMLTNQTFVDPLISIIIGFMLLISALNVLKDVVHVLLEGVPKNININEVENTIKSVDLVIGVDDLHIWAISSHYAALSCHIIIEDKHLDKSLEIIRKIKNLLNEKFKIKHSTIEVNFAICKNSVCILTKK